MMSSWKERSRVPMIWRRWRVEIGELPLDVLHLIVHLDAARRVAQRFGEEELVVAVAAA